jgi:hypothetical protein
MNVKGQWEIAHYEDGLLEGLNFIRDTEGKTVCTLSKHPEETNNAHLIAAAPAMYEALKEAVALLNHMYAEAIATKPDRDKIEAIAYNGLSGHSQIKQALALAEGRA